MRSLSAILALAIVSLPALAAETVIVGRTWDLDGQDDYLEMAGKFNGAFASDFTLDMAIEPLGNGGGFERILDNGSFRIFLDVQAPLTLLRAEIVGVVFSQATVSLGAETLVTVTCEQVGSNVDMGLYIDGVLVDSEVGQGALSDVTSPLYLGTAQVSPGGLLYRGGLGPIVVDGGVFPP